VNRRLVHDAASECGFDLVGVTAAHPVPDFARFRSWVDRGLAGEMRYLTDHRAEIRNNPEQLLPGVRSIICVGMVYNGPEPLSTEFSDLERAWISRYAWGDDYHRVLRARLEALAGKLTGIENFSWRACVDTAPLLERSLAAQAGLGWIGRNTCLINQQLGSWFFLGELLTTLDLEPDSPPPDRCGTCTRCIEACPTEAIVPSPDGRFELDARLCISYFTIELRNSIPDRYRPAVGLNVFGCDICQDVCPWNRRASLAADSAFGPRQFAPSLDRLAALSESEFREMFRGTPIPRAKYRGFLRNVAVAMGNAGLEKFRSPLDNLARSEDPLVAEHALWALTRIDALR
jgi:epoxyqueuosine reductase